jgi:hypothetical protein
MKTCNKSKCNKSTRTETKTDKTRQVGLKTQTDIRSGGNHLKAPK